MENITARWMFYIQIIFLAISLWLFPFFVAPLKAEPLLTKDASAAALVMAASLNSLHGPVEYRPAQKPITAQNAQQDKGAQIALITSQEKIDRNNVSYSGNLWAVKAKP